MDDKDKQYKKLRLGLAIKRLMDSSKEIGSSIVIKEDASSFRKIEKATGIRHATIVEIVNAKKNPAWSTIDAILEGLEMSLSEFAAVYDAITDKDITNYKTRLEENKKQRQKKFKRKS